MSWSLYIIKCRDRSLYTGITTDILRRLKEHNTKKGGFYTRNKLPVELVYQEPMRNRSQALKREAAIKKMTRKQKIQLVKASLPLKIPDRMIKNIQNSGYGLFILAAVLFSPALTQAQGIQAGSPAPYFKVLSGSNEELALDDIKGKVAVIFYETKDVIERNRPLKDELNRFYDAQTDSAKKLILRVPVINCKGVFFTDIWKNNLKQSSQKEGLTIYGDWDGKMSLAYGIQDRESNLIIIGRDGRVKYFFAGAVEEKDFGLVKDLLAAEVRISLL
jgi:putative endonuclease